MNILTRLVRPLPGWARGVIAALCVVAGIVLVFRPFVSLASMIWALAIALVVDGVLELIQMREHVSQWWIHAALGAAWIIGGVLVLGLPGLTIRVITLIVGLALLGHGLFQAWVSVWRRRGVARVSGVLFAVSRVALGLLALTWPDVTVLVIAAIFGVQLVISGVDLMLGVIRQRSSRTSGPARHRLRQTLQVGGAVVAVVATGLLFLVSTNLSGTPIPDAFYEPPGDVPSEPGVLLRSEPFAQGVPAGAEGWRILYTTTRGEDRPAVASAVIVTPIRQPDTAGFPVIAWAHGTTGYSTGCAPSLLEEPFAAGGMPALPEAIAEGWAVVATDYAGLGTAGHQPYLIGEGEGRSVLDAVRAAGQLETAQLAPSTVVWGHSQGGHAALWAGGLHPEYAPEIELDGVAAIAPASDLPEFLSAVSGSMVGGVFGSFVVEAYAAEYPDIVASDYVRPGARIALEEMSRRCLTDASTLVSVATTLAGYKPVWKGDPARGPLLERARENVPTLPVEAPLLIAQGQADDLVLLDLQRGYVDARCDEGWSLEYHTYADRDHMGVVADDSPLNADLMAWTAARLSGQPFAPGCTAHSSR